MNPESASVAIGTGFEKGGRVRHAFEQEFVVGYLARPDDRTGAPEPTPTEWPAVVEFARKNGLAPSLFAVLRGRNVLERVPTPSRMELTRQYRRTGIVNALFLDELDRLSGAFRAAGVPLIALKGAAFLAEGIFDPALRPMDDLDLLVREGDLREADAILAGAGYVPNEASHGREWYFRNHHHLVPLYHPRKKITVEVHRNLLCAKSPFRIDAEGLWERSRPVRAGGSGVRGLSTEDTLLHLSLHLGYANCFREPLKTLFDIRRVVTRSGDRIDWERMAAEAERWGCADCVLAVLSLAREAVGAEIPAAALHRMRRGSRLGRAGLRTYEGLVRRYAFRPAGAPSIPSRRVLDILFRELPKPVPLRRKAGAVLRQLLPFPDPARSGPNPDRDTRGERPERRPVWNPR